MFIKARNNFCCHRVEKVQGVSNAIRRTQPNDIYAKLQREREVGLPLAHPYYSAICVVPLTHNQFSEVLVTLGAASGCLLLLHDSCYLGQALTEEE